VVLLPTFGDTADGWAAAVLQKAFPKRKVIGIDCREMLRGFGTLHALAAPQPKTA
jgi:agmatine deiminase